MINLPNASSKIEIFVYIVLILATASTIALAVIANALDSIACSLADKQDQGPGA